MPSGLSNPPFPQPSFPPPSLSCLPLQLQQPVARETTAGWVGAPPPHPPLFCCKTGRSWDKARGRQGVGARRWGLATVVPTPVRPRGSPSW